MNATDERFMKVYAARVTRLLPHFQKFVTFFNPVKNDEGNYRYILYRSYYLHSN